MIVRFLFVLRWSLFSAFLFSIPLASQSTASSSQEAATTARAASAPPTAATRGPDLGTIPVVRYRHGNLDAQWIPYGRRWAIEGAPTASAGGAVLVRGEVIPQRWMDRYRRDSVQTYQLLVSARAAWLNADTLATQARLALRARPEDAERRTAAARFEREADAARDAWLRAALHVNEQLEQSKRMNRDYSASCWRKGGTSNTPDTFRVVFGEQYLGSKYHVRISFYGDFDERVLAPVTRTAYDSVVERVRVDRRMSPDAVRSIFQDHVRRNLEIHAASDDGVRFIKSEAEGRCSLTAKAPPITLSDAAGLDLATAALAQVHRDEAGARVDWFADSLQTLESAGTSLIAKLSQMARQKGVGILGTDPEALRGSLRHPFVLDSASHVRLEALATSCTTPALRPHDCSLLLDILETHTKRGRAVSELGKAAAELRRLAPLTTPRFEVREAYSQVGRALIDATSWDDSPATADRLRIGTSIGFGATALSRSGNPFEREADSDAFALYSIKFYRHAVDKSLPDPYLGRKSARFSLMLGVVRNTALQYRGQALSGIVAGLLPGYGVNYDVSRDFTLQVGGVVFRQPSVNPAGTGRTYVRSTPFVGLGFDFDGANRVGTLLKSIIPQ